MNELREELRTLTERVSRLEKADREKTAQSPIPAETFWALAALQARLADDPSTAEGAVMLVGSLTLPSGAPVSWQQSAGTAGLLEIDWADRAAAFAALGHPVRIEILRHILLGRQTTADLAAIESLGTTGQLHHHLRPLMAAGWVRQGGRGVYEVPAARVVPLLTCLAGVER